MPSAEALLKDGLRGGTGQGRAGQRVLTSSEVYSGTDITSRNADTSDNGFVKPPCPKFYSENPPVILADCPKHKM